MSLTKQDLQSIEGILDRKLNGFATKDDLKSFPTKEDIKSFATKEDIKGFATKDDIKGFANRLDLEKMESRIIAAMGLLQRDTFSRFEDHEQRIARLERKASA
jgi:hypothetical protein